MAEDKNYLGMSDEEIANVTMSEIEEEERKEAEKQEANNDVSASDIDDTDDTDTVDAIDEDENLDTAETAEADDANELDDETELDSESTDDDGKEPEQTNEDNPADEQDSFDESQKDNPADKNTEDTSEEGDQVDYKAAYEKLLAPFRANGKNIQVDSVDDAITLMQMGANYSQRMAAIKPHFSKIKMLENNGLLDDDKLNHLIEVGKGNPEAIKKVVADNKLDAYDFNAEEDAKYVPDNHTVNDSEVELDMVIKELEHEPEFSRTASIVGQQWDDASKNAILQNPNYLRVIHRDVASGKFDTVNAELEKQAMLGKVPPGLSKIDAYAFIASQMSQQVNEPSQQQTPSYTPPVKPDLTRPKDKKRSAAKKAIASTKKVSASTKTDIDVLGMSDEEFEKATKRGLFKTL